MSTEKQLKWKISDILGCQVYDQNGSVLGNLADVLTTGNNDIWVIKNNTEELLLPALKTVVVEVNILSKKVFVKLPQGYESIYGNKIPSDICLDYFGWTVYED